MPTPVFRFAPSPNGCLHLGHAFSALLNFEMARKSGGRFLLRIEDIDKTRCRPEYEAGAYDDLAWLGLEWETPARRQSEHLADYERALKDLAALGLLYPSFESRAELARLAGARDVEASRRLDPDGAPLYAGYAKTMPAAERDRLMRSGAPFALRLDMAAAMAKTGALKWRETGRGPDSETGWVEAAPQAWGDVVLARKEVPTSYHLCVVIDDALQGATHVVRGLDLFWATSVHRLLQRLLDLPAPVYHHHRLILDEHGRKLSKSTRAAALRELRARGFKPHDIRRMIGLQA